uniref:Innexin n=1 Tax=Macrostomum lignano TaxID=282301 RepID=A0A1I8HFV2_9PLAT
ARLSAAGLLADSQVPRLPDRDGQLLNLQGVVEHEPKAAHVTGRVLVELLGVLVQVQRRVELTQGSGLHCARDFLSEYFFGVIHAEPAAAPEERVVAIGDASSPSSSCSSKPMPADRARKPDMVADLAIFCQLCRPLTESGMGKGAEQLRGNMGDSRLGHASALSWHSIGIRICASYIRFGTRPARGGPPQVSLRLEAAGRASCIPDEMLAWLLPEPLSYPAAVTYMIGRFQRFRISSSLRYFLLTADGLHRQSVINFSASQQLLSARVRIRALLMVEIWNRSFKFCYIFCNVNKGLSINMIPVLCDATNDTDSLSAAIQFPDPGPTSRQLAVAIQALSLLALVLNCGLVVLLARTPRPRTGAKGIPLLAAAEIGMNLSLLVMHAEVWTPSCSSAVDILDKFNYSFEAWHLLRNFWLCAMTVARAKAVARPLQSRDLMAPKRQACLFTGFGLASAAWSCLDLTLVSCAPNSVAKTGWTRAGPAETLPEHRGRRDGDRWRLRAHRAPGAAHQRRREAQASRIVVSIAVAFALLELPYALVVYVGIIWTIANGNKAGFPKEFAETLHILYRINHLLIVADTCLNLFVLLCLSASFRQQMMRRILACRQAGQRRRQQRSLQQQRLQRRSRRAAATAEGGADSYDSILHLKQNSVLQDVMNQDFFSKVGDFKLTDSSLRSDNDFSDRLNYYYTSIMIVIFAVVVSARQYVGKPLQCWIPAEFSEQWEKYSESYCWIKNTYFVPMNETGVPDHAHVRRQYEINYYQYVPFILALMALALNVPNIVWKILNTRTGVSLKTIVHNASSVISVDPIERPQAVVSLAKTFEEAVIFALDDKNRKSRTERLRRTLRGGFGSYLILSYVFTKMLFFCASFGLLLAVCCMLSSSYRVFDLGVFSEIVQGKSWRNSGIFPRITHCDFEIRRLNVRHPYTMQCVLTVNLFNEKIFVFLWFWYLVISAANIVSLLYWLLYCLPFKQYDFIDSYLSTSDKYHGERDSAALQEFVNRHLRNDGVFLLRLIASNSGHLVTTELVHRLWRNKRRLTRQIMADFDIGSIPQEQVAQLKSVFTLFDRSGCGSITDIVNEVDQDGNGSIEFEEFVQMIMIKLQRRTPTEETRGAFKVFDKDGDGYITRDELAASLASMRIEATPEELDDMFKEADLDCDGRISYDDFKLGPDLRLLEHNNIKVKGCRGRRAAVRVVRVLSRRRHRGQSAGRQLLQLVAQGLRQRLPAARHRLGRPDVARQNSREAAEQERRHRIGVLDNVSLPGGFEVADGGRVGSKAGQQVAEVGGLVDAGGGGRGFDFGPQRPQPASGIVSCRRRQAAQRLPESLQPRQIVGERVGLVEAQRRSGLLNCDALQRGFCSLQRRDEEDKECRDEEDKECRDEADKECRDEADKECRDEEDKYSCRPRSGRRTQRRASSALGAASPASSKRQRQQVLGSQSAAQLSCQTLRPGSRFVNRGGRSDAVTGVLGCWRRVGGTQFREAVKEAQSERLNKSCAAASAAAASVGPEEEQRLHQVDPQAALVLAERGAPEGGHRDGDRLVSAAANRRGHRLDDEVQRAEGAVSMAVMVISGRWPSSMLAIIARVSRASCSAAEPTWSGLKDDSEEEEKETNLGETTLVQLLNRGGQVVKVEHLVLKQHQLLLLKQIWVWHGLTCLSCERHPRHNQMPEMRSFQIVRASGGTPRRAGCLSNFALRVGSSPPNGAATDLIHRRGADPSPGLHQSVLDVDLSRRIVAAEPIVDDVAQSLHEDAPGDAAPRSCPRLRSRCWTVELRRQSVRAGGRRDHLGAAASLNKEGLRFARQLRAADDVECGGDVVERHADAIHSVDISAGVAVASKKQTKASALRCRDRAASPISNRRPASAAAVLAAAAAKGRNVFTPLGSHRSVSSMRSCSANRPCPTASATSAAVRWRQSTAPDSAPASMRHRARASSPEQAAQCSGRRWRASSRPLVLAAVGQRSGAVFVTTVDQPGADGAPRQQLPHHVGVSPPDGPVQSGGAGPALAVRARIDSARVTDHNAASLADGGAGAQQKSNGRQVTPGGRGGKQRRQQLLPSWVIGS